MSDKNFTLLESEAISPQKLQLFAEVTILMGKGAGYAAAFCLAVWALFAAMIFAGSLLPEESKEAIDPTPWSALEQVQPDALT